MATVWSGERIKVLRHLFGLTQEALAEMAGVRQPQISDVERGVTDATDELLSALARATGTPMSFFDVVPGELPLDTLRFRKNSTSSVRDTDRAKALFREAHRVVTDMARRARYPKPTLPTAEGGALGEGDLERLAAETREALRLGPDGPIPHVTRALERSGIAAVPMVLRSEEDGEANSTPGHFGMSYWAGPGAHALVGFFPGNTADRDRFTLGHELGHLVLHTHRRGDFDFEDEANRFAGEFLLPTHQAREIFSPELTLMDYARLKAIWGMSIQALVMRALHTGCIDQARHRSLFVQLSARGWRRNEPVVIHPEEPLLTWKLLSKEFGTDSPYAAAVEPLGLPPVILRSLIPQPAATKKPTPVANNNRRRPQKNARIVQLGDRR